MTRCVFVNEGDKCRCVRCGFLAGARDGDCNRILRTCDVSEPSEAIESALIAKAKRYCMSVKRWNDAGRPRRGDAEVNEYYAICKRCENLNSRGSCKICGCRVNKSTRALLNKIKMATETCPLGKW